MLHADRGRPSATRSVPKRRELGTPGEALSPLEHRSLRDTDLPADAGIAPTIEREQHDPRSHDEAVLCGTGSSKPLQLQTRALAGLDVAGERSHFPREQS